MNEPLYIEAGVPPELARRMARVDELMDQCPWDAPTYRGTDKEWNAYWDGIPDELFDLVSIRRWGHPSVLERDVILPGGGWSAWARCNRGDGDLCYVRYGLPHMADSDCIVLEPAQGI